MLKKLLVLFLRECLFWLIFFFICRSIFLLYTISELKGISFRESISTFWFAIYLDTSMASYFLGISFILFSLLGFFNQKVFLIINCVYVITLVVFFSL
ncbi:MAG: sulfatase, partial [Bacteroidota bacterium]